MNLRTRFVVVLLGLGLIAPALRAQHGAKDGP